MARAIAIVAVLLALASQARADTLYKCVDPAGLTTIQNAPCPKGYTQAWARETAPEPPPTPEQLAAAQARREQAEREARARAADEALAAQRAQEAEAMREELVAEEREQADLAATRAGAPAGSGEPVPAVEPEDAGADPEARCNEAKSFAQSLRAKAWIDLDEAQWRRVYGWVVQECR